MAEVVHVHWHKPNLFRCGPVRLMPGLNSIDKAMYDRVKGNAVWQAKEARGSSEGLTVAFPNSELNGPDLVSEIALSTDHARLKELTYSKFKKVREAAKARLEEVGPGEVLS